MTNHRNAPPFEIKGHLLIRNAILSMVAQVLPLALGLVSVPLVLHGLGVERFGLLAFSWTLTGIFSLFDLGLASSVTKFVAEALGRGERRSIAGIVWPAVAGQAVLGAIGGIAMIVVAPPLVTRVLNVSPHIQPEAIASFRIVGLILPTMLLFNTFRGSLEAAQRFDVASAAKGASSASTFLIPMVGVFLHWELPQIIGLLLVTRILLLAMLVAACFRILPVLREHPSPGGSELRQLLGFGGWLTVSGLVGFALSYGDRVAIGTSLTMNALTYYTVPLDLIGRLGVIAGTLAAVLLPAFSTLGGARNTSRLTSLFDRSMKYVVLGTWPGFALLALFANDLLTAWLGPAVAAESAPVLKVLAVGVAFQVLAAVPSSVVIGLGHPKLTATFHLLQTPVYLAAVWWLARTHGIRGVALAWSGRFAVEAAVLTWAATRMGIWTWRGAWGIVRRALLPVAGLVLLSTGLNALPVDLAWRATSTAVVVAAFAWWAWARILEPDERRRIADLKSGTVAVAAICREKWQSFSFYRGRTSLAAALVRWGAWGVRCLLRRPAVVDLPNYGMRLHLPARWKGCWKAIFVFRERFFEVSNPELAFLQQILKPGDVFIDAGAYQGWYTLAAASKVGDRGLVLAFEPNPEAFALLARNIALSGRRNVRAFPVALMAATGSAWLYRGPGDELSSALAPVSEGAGRVPVLTRRLDDVITELEIRQVACMKLDVQGAEASLLAGAGEILRRSRPILIFEVEPVASHAMGVSPREAWDLLADAGYQFFRSSAASLIPLRAFPILDDRMHMNVIAIPFDRTLPRP